MTLTLVLTSSSSLIGKNHFGGNRNISKNIRKTHSTLRRTASFKLSFASAQMRRNRRRSTSRRNGRPNPINDTTPGTAMEWPVQLSRSVGGFGGFFSYGLAAGGAGGSGGALIRAVM